MKLKALTQLGVLASGCLLMISCAKHAGGAADFGLGNEGDVAHGLGEFTHFAGQDAGESFTTEAPHNQLYLFAYDDSTLNPKYMDSLNAQADYLKSHSRAHVLLAGHTDERGSREYNIALGERRANEVAEILRMSGVEHSQYRVVSYGKERPANYGHDEQSHRQNRRVEFVYEATR